MNANRVAGCLLLLCAACSKPPKPVEDLSGHENLSAYTLTLVRGQRDGDVLNAHASFSDGPSSLLVDLRFAIDTSASLQSGRWQWVTGGHIKKSGTVTARSVMFLGGQNGRPPTSAAVMICSDLSGSALAAASYRHPDDGTRGACPYPTRRIALTS